MNIKLDDMARYQAFYLWLAANAALDERVDKTLRVAELGVKVLEILSNGTLEYDDDARRSLHRSRAALGRVRRHPRSRSFPEPAHLRGLGAGGRVMAGVLAEWALLAVAGIVAVSIVAYLWGFFSQAGANHADDMMGYVEEEVG